MKDFLFEPDNDTYARAIISTAVSRIALNEPERKNEVINWYKDVIHSFLKVKDDEDICDSEVISFLIGDIADLGEKN